jgi:hypothetical protein
VRTLITALAIAAIAGTLAPPAMAADAVVVRAISAQSYEGTIEAGGDTHAFLLEDFAPQRFSVALQAANGSTLVPDLLLEDPSSADVTAALARFRIDRRRSVVVRNADTLSTPGTWTLRVRGKSGTTGGYRLQVTAKVLPVHRGAGSVPAAPTIDFFAPTASTVTLKAIPRRGSSLKPVFSAVTPPPCVSTEVVPGLKPGTATMTAPWSGDYVVTVAGDGGTKGAFSWTAKVKPFKPSRVPVRVNGEAAYFPGAGPAPAKLIARPVQEVFGFDTDGIDLCWREVRTTGDPARLGENSIACLTVKGLKTRILTDSFANDPSPPPRAIVLGPTSAAAVSDGTLYLVSRSGTGAVPLASPLTTPVSVLVSRDAGFVLQTHSIMRYDFTGNATTASANGYHTYQDVAFGGRGVVFALVTGPDPDEQTQAGDLELRTAPFAGGGDTLLVDLGPNPGLQALTGFGPFVYVAVGDGAGGSVIHLASACNPGTAVQLAALPAAPVLGLAADESNVYAIENDPVDGRRIRQIPRGGGVATVIARNNETTGFEILDAPLRAARGFVYFLGNDGKEGFYRVKRR